MKRKILPSLLFFLSITSFAEPLTVDQVDGFAKPYERKCIDSSSKDPMLRNFSSNRLKEFCECSSKYITDRLTQADIILVEEEGDARKIISLSVEANRYCAIKELT